MFYSKDPVKFLKQKIAVTQREVVEAQDTADKWETQVAYGKKRLERMILELEEILTSRARIADKEKETSNA